MKKTTILFWGLASFAVFALAGTASAAPCEPNSSVCISKECKAADVGRTSMDYDKKSIIACLVNSTGTGYIWKSMASSVDTGFPINHAEISVQLKSTAVPGYQVKYAVCKAKTDADGRPYVKIEPQGHNHVPVMATPWVKGDYVESSEPVGYGGLWYDVASSCSVSPAGLTLSNNDGANFSTKTLFVPWD